MGAVLIALIASPALGNDAAPGPAARPDAGPVDASLGGPRPLAPADAAPPVTPAQQPDTTPADKTPGETPDTARSGTSGIAPTATSDTTRPRVPGIARSGTPGVAPTATPAMVPAGQRADSAADAGPAADATSASPAELDAGQPDAAPDDPADAGPGHVDAGPGHVDAGVTAPAAAPVEPPSHRRRAGVIIRVILGLCILVVLAYLGAHPRVKHFQQELRIAQLTTAGFPFVLFGLIARHPSVGVLTDDVLQQLTPMLNFGLGWLGFLIGVQLDVRFLDKLPKGTGLLVVIEASAPFAVTVAICGGVMMAFGMDYRDPALIRDALLLGAAGAMTATLSGSSLSEDRPWSSTGWAAKRGVHGLVSQLDEVWGVGCLLFMVAFLRPMGSASTWALPGTAWVFVTLGLGVTLGLLVFVIVRAPHTWAEFLAVIFGFVAFAAGLAGYLRLSPIVVCFIAGVLITNFPCEQRDSLRRILSGLERPIHLTFLIIAGALWDVSDWRGWALVPLFVLGRFGGRWLGMFAGEKAFAAQGQPVPAHGAVITPLSVLAMALVVSVERLYGGDTISWVMTAVIGGAYVTELVVQLVPARLRDSTATSHRYGPLMGASDLDTDGGADGDANGDLDGDADGDDLHQTPGATPKTVYKSLDTERPDSNEEQGW